MKLKSTLILIFILGICCLYPHITYAEDAAIIPGDTYSIKHCPISDDDGSIVTDECYSDEFTANDDATIDYSLGTNITGTDYSTSIVTVEDLDGTEIRSSVIASPCEGETETNVGINTVTHSVSQSTRRGLIKSAESNIHSPAMMTTFMNSMNTSDEYDTDARETFGNAGADVINIFIETLKTNGVTNETIESMESNLTCSSDTEAKTLNDYSKKHYDANEKTEEADAYTDMADSSSDMVEAIIEAATSAGIDADIVQLAIEAAASTMATSIETVYHSGGISNDQYKAMDSSFEVMRTRMESHIEIHQKEEALEVLRLSVGEDTTLLTMINELENQMNRRRTDMDALTEKHKQCFMNPMSCGTDMSTFKDSFSGEMTTIEDSTTGDTNNTEVNEHTDTFKTELADNTDGLTQSDLESMGIDDWGMGEMLIFQFMNKGIDDGKDFSNMDSYTDSPSEYTHRHSGNEESCGDDCTDYTQGEFSNLNPMYQTLFTIHEDMSLEEDSYMEECYDCSTSDSYQDEYTDRYSKRMDKYASKHSMRENFSSSIGDTYSEDIKNALFMFFE